MRGPFGSSGGGDLHRLLTSSLGCVMGSLTSGGVFDRKCLRVAAMHEWRKKKGRAQVWCDGWEEERKERRQMAQQEPGHARSTGCEMKVRCERAW